MKAILVSIFAVVGLLSLGCYYHSMRQSLKVVQCCPEENKIMFYDHNWWYYEFCNFYLADLQFDETWPSVEHYYQAHKFNSSFHDLYEQVRSLPYGKDAWDFARKHKNQTRPDWQDVMDDVMMTALKAKYTQHKDLADILVKTGTQFLEERTDDDDYWGDGKYYNGSNKLGLFLMKIRNELQSGILKPVPVN